MIRSGAGLVAVLLLAFAATSLRLWQVEFPPLIDWPNHLARHAIGCDDPVFGRMATYYEFELRWVPNLTADLFHRLPWACADIFLTQKILIQFAILGLILSAFALHYAIWRRFSVWPGVVALVAFNMNLGYGFENYLLAMPLAIGLLALWVALDRTNPWLRLAIVAPLGLGLYFCHLYAFAFFGIMLAALEMRTAWQGWRWQSAPRRAVLQRLIAAALVGVLPALHFALILGTGTGPDVGVTEYGGLLSRQIAAMSLTSAQIYLLLTPFARIEAMLALSFLLVLPLVLRTLGGRFSFHAGFRWAAVAALALVVLTPSVMATVHFTQVRFPALALVVLVAATDLRLPRGREIGLAALLALAFLARGQVTLDDWRAHEVQMHELLDATAALGPEPRLMFARSGDDGQVRRHTHSISHLAMQHGVVTDTLFHGANPLTPVPEIAAHASVAAFPPTTALLMNDLDRAARADSLSSRQQWTQFFTHLIVFHTRTARPGPIPQFGALLHSGSFFDLYQLPPIPTETTAN